MVLCAGRLYGAGSTPDPPQSVDGEGTNPNTSAGIDVDEILNFDPSSMDDDVAEKDILEDILEHIDTGDVEDGGHDDHDYESQAIFDQRASGQLR